MSLSTSEQPILPGESTLCVMQPLSFSDEAARLVQADEPSTRIVYADDIDGVWDAIERGQYGLIPFENSSKGVVWKHFDRLRGNNVNVLGEVHLHVRMCMGGVVGAKPEQATHAYSHPVGLAQCSKRLDAIGIAPANRFAFDATPDAAKKVAELQDPFRICLASRLAIENVGLQVLESDAANHKGAANITQFFVVHRNGQLVLPDTCKEYHAAIIEPEYERIGVLNDILGIIRAARVDLVSLHSQKLESGDGYRFFMEMEAGADPLFFDVMRRKLACCSAVRSVQWIGSWDKRLYSGSIHTESFQHQPHQGRPLVGGEELDVSKRFHGMEITPDNYPGVLFDITHDIRTSDLNLVFVHSRAEGHKRYSFLMGMDAQRAGSRRLAIAVDQMRNDTHLRSIQWLCSTDSIESIRSLEPVA